MLAALLMLFQLLVEKPFVGDSEPMLHVLQQVSALQQFLHTGIEVLVHLVHQLLQPHVDHVELLIAVLIHHASLCWN